MPQDEDFHADEGTGAHPVVVIAVVATILLLLGLFFYLLWPYLRPVYPQPVAASSMW